MKNKAFTVLATLLLLLVVFLLFGCDDFSLTEILAYDISLIPGEITLNLDEIIKFEVSAGIAPFVFTEVGDGIVPNGIYTAPSTTGNFIISVEDDLNRTAEAYVTVVDAANMVSLVPEIVSTGINGEIQFAISGGVGVYTDSDIVLDPDLGSLGSPVYNASTDTYDFVYTAANTPGLEIIMVTDDNGQTAEAYITITSDTGLMIIPDVAEVEVDDVLDFSASGGAGAGTYTYSIISGSGNIDSGNGRYTAPSIIGVTTIQVEDSDSNTAEATVYIVADLLTINPSVALTLYVGDEFTFSASNGNPPYSFSILGNEPTGSIDSGTGLFTALAKDNSVTVVVTDSNGNTSTCRVKIKS